GEPGQGAFYRQIAQADQRHTDEIEPRYRDIDLPVLVCWGEEDTWLPVAQARELVKRIPGARLRLLPGAGHLVQEDAPAQLTGVLLRFLDAHGLLFAAASSFVPTPLGADSWFDRRRAAVRPLRNWAGRCCGADPPATSRGYPHRVRCRL